MRTASFWPLVSPLSRSRASTAPVLRQRHRPAVRGGQHRQHAPLCLDRAVGDEGPVRAPALGLDQLAAADEPRDRRVDLGQCMAPRRMAERHRPDLRFRDPYPPLLDMRHCPRDRLQHAQLRFMG